MEFICCVGDITMIQFRLSLSVSIVLLLLLTAFLAIPQAQAGDVAVTSFEGIGATTTTLCSAGYNRFDCTRFGAGTETIITVSGDSGLSMQPQGGLANVPVLSAPRGFRAAPGEATSSSGIDVDSLPVFIYWKVRENTGHNGLGYRMVLQLSFNAAEQAPDSGTFDVMLREAGGVHTINVEGVAMATYTNPAEILITMHPRVAGAAVLYDVDINNVRQVTGSSWSDVDCNGGALSCDLTEINGIYLYALCDVANCDVGGGNPAIQATSLNLNIYQNEEVITGPDGSTPYDPLLKPDRITCQILKLQYAQNISGQYVWDWGDGNKTVTYAPYDTHTYIGEYKGKVKVTIQALGGEPIVAKADVEMGTAKCIQGEFLRQFAPLFVVPPLALGSLAVATPARKYGILLLAGTAFMTGYIFLLA